MRVLAAVSGGVDSAVAAARAVDAGHEVVGVHMALSPTQLEDSAVSAACYTKDDAGDAQRIADLLGIPFHVWDLSDSFQTIVIDDFLAEYAAGRTPNPCVRCNEFIKFRALLEKASALEFDAVCTGHYARLVDNGNTRELHRAANVDKDQSYVLAVLDPERLAQAMFPLGDIASKEEVREEAAARGFSVSAKPDSYDICFITDGDTQGFLRRHLGEAPGPIVDVDGQELGHHEGVFAYTIGQRKGLGIERPAADGKPRYVLDIQPTTNTVVVGTQASLAVARVVGEQSNWLIATEPGDSYSCLLQVRAHGEPVAAVVTAQSDGRVEVEVTGVLNGVAPGQSMVFYEGTRVLGQATIASTER